MPVSMLIHFFPHSQLTRSASGGKWLHALVFNLFNRISPEYAEYIHKQYDYKLFTLSPLRTKGKEHEIEEGQLCHVRLTLLDDQKISELLCILAEIDQQELRLGNTTISIYNVQVSPETNNIWVRYQSWEELVESPPKEFINLQWHSPTAIKQQHRNSLFPIPETIFYSWQKRWLKISPIPLPQELTPDDWFTSSQISSYNLQTTTVYFGNFKQKGFKGKASYEIHGDDNIKKTANILSHFAFYCGTGYKTTIGMGQTNITSKSLDFSKDNNQPTNSNENPNI